MADNGYTVAQAYVQIMPSTKNFGKSLTNDIDPGVTASGKSAGGSFTSGFKKALGITTVVFTAAAAMVGKLTESAIEAFAEYEQLTGGIEKLFGDAADEVIANASDAYKTAGMSANDYMETVTGFSASLLQSLGDDTAAAVDYADMAIQDMSDNANVFGTDMESIQNAYQGFAKGNYTMLDNLKLGYGGTKTEMERLIEDANRVKAANGEMADLSIDSFADIVEAIHIMQGEMEISGTTAEEASTTISGSISSMKAAWENLLTGLAAGDQDVSGLMSNLFETIFGVEDETGERIGGVLNNILPRVSNVLSALGTEVRKYLPEIIGYIPKILEEVLPDLIKNAAALVTAFVEALPDILDVFVQQIPLFMESIGDALLQGLTSLTENLPAIADSLSGALSSVLTYVSENADTLIDAVADFLSTLLTEGIGILAENTDELVKAFMAVIKAIIKAAFEHPELVATIIGMKAITSLGGAIITSIGTALTAGKSKLVTAIKSLLTGSFTEATAGNTVSKVGSQGGSSVLGKVGSWLTGGSTAGFAVGTGLATLGVTAVGAGIMLGSQELEKAIRHNSEAWKAEQEILDEIYASDNFVSDAHSELTRIIGEQGLEILNNGGSWVQVAESMGYAGMGAQGVSTDLREMLSPLYQDYLATKDLTGSLDDFSEGMEETAGKTSMSSAEIKNAMLSEFNKAAMEATKVGTTMSSNVSGSMLAGKPTAVQNASNFINATMSAMKIAVDNKKPDVTGAVDKVEAGMESSINPVKGAMTTAGDTSAKNLDSSFGAWSYTVEKTVTKTYNLFKNILGHSLPNDMTVWGTQAGSNFLSGMQGSASGIGSAVNNLSSNIRGAFAGMSDYLRGVGYNAGEGLYNGLASWGGSLQQLARSIANSIINTLSKVMHIGSPSKVTREIGEFVGEGLAIGLEDSTGDAVDAARAMATGVVSAAGSVTAGINGDSIQTALAGTYATAVAGAVGNLNASPAQVSSIELLAQINERLAVLSRMQMVMDTGEVVGVLAAPMNNQMSAIRLREGRA